MAPFWAMRTCRQAPPCIHQQPCPTHARQLRLAFSTNNFLFWAKTASLASPPLLKRKSSERAPHQTPNAIAESRGGAPVSGSRAPWSAAPWQHTPSGPHLRMRSASMSPETPSCRPSRQQPSHMRPSASPACDPTRVVSRKRVCHPRLGRGSLYLLFLIAT